MFAQKINNRAAICSVEFSFDGDIIPSTIVGYQPFYNNIQHETSFSKVDFGKASVRFQEDSQETLAGTIYKQSLELVFTSLDKDRAARINKLRTLKYIKVGLTDGRFYLLGRNDYGQNRRPLIEIKSNHRRTAIEIKSQSMAPCGFTPDPSQFGLPAWIPVSLIQIP